MAGELRGLSLHQPGASRVASGRYRLLNLSWTTSYRGRLAIHASASRAHVPAADGVQPFAVGVILATVTLLGVYPVRELPFAWQSDPFANGPFCFLLADDVCALAEPVPCQGKRWLWALDDATRADVERRTAQVAA